MGGFPRCGRGGRCGLRRGCDGWCGGGVGVSPRYQRGDDGLSDVLLVGGVGDGCGVAAFGGGEWRDFDSEGRAGEVIERANGGVGEDGWNAGFLERGAELVGEAEA